MREFGVREVAEADRELDDFTTLWQHGGSPLLRELIDGGTIELLGGPLSHPFQPLLNPRLREFALREGLADAHQRLGAHPNRHLGTGMRIRARAWNSTMPQPASGTSWSTARRCTATRRLAVRSAIPMSSRSVAICRSATGCGRRSPAIPGHAAYRDFHTYDHVTGLKPARVTGRNVPSDAKAPYDPARAERAVDGHVADFVEVVRQRLVTETDRIGRPAHVIAAFDTELFGHWWYEGPVWLERVLRALPAAGIRVGTLSDAVADGFTGTPVELPPSSWGSGKDWSVWSGEKVADLVQLNTEVVDTALSTVDKALRADRVRRRPGRPRRRRRPDPAGDAADGVERLALHGQQGLRGRLRPLPRASACACHPRDRGCARIGPP